MAVARYRESVAHQKAMTLIVEVYSASTKFPKEEQFGLTNQVRRASVSIASNIAEGQGRLTLGEFLHFLGMARGSAFEVQTQLQAAGLLNYGEKADLRKAYGTANEVIRILNASIKTNQAKLKKGKRVEDE